MNLRPSYILLCVAILFSVQSLLPAQSNFVLIDSLSFSVCKQLVSRIQKNEAVHIAATNHSSQWLIVQNTMRALKENSIAKSDSSGKNLNIGIADCGVRYLVHPTERDSLLRVSRVELRASFDGNSIEPVIAERQDCISRSDVAFLENPKHEFTSSLIPPAPKSTWDDILEPLVVVAALATTVVLLFTVRSQ